jgi:hypothetical protein
MFWGRVSGLFPQIGDNNGVNVSLFGGFAILPLGEL